MAALPQEVPQGMDRFGSYISLGVDRRLSSQILVERGSLSRLERDLSYKPEEDPFFMEALRLCDAIFYPLRDRFLTKLWKKPFGAIYKVDFDRGIIAFDFPITSFYGKMSYSRIVIIPRSLILDAKELQALWTAAFSIEKPMDGFIDSMTVAVFTLKAGEKLPTYRFERLGKRSKVEFMAFVGLPARTMAKFLEILIPFFEKRLRAFLKRFEIPLRYVGYSLGGRGWFIKSKKGGISTNSFTKWRPNVVDYIKNVKSGWLKSALKGLMNLINELVDAYKEIVIPRMKFQLGLSSLRKALPQIIYRLFGNLRFTPEQIKQILEMVLSEDVRPKPPNAPLKLSESEKSYRKPSEGISE